MIQYRVLSLGAGVQSSTLLLLSLRGELPRLDAAIFADTQYEPRAVYDHLVWLETLARAAGIPVHRVSKGDIRADTLGAHFGKRPPGAPRWASLPFFIAGRAGGGDGMVRRQCTKEYKLAPIRRQIRRLAGLAPGEQARGRVHIENWIGISADETSRVRTSRDYWITLRYPLIFDLKPPWRRQDCLAWLRAQYPDHPVPRSACIGCPFHSNAEWRHLRDRDPAAWQDAVAFDAGIRHLPGLRGAGAYLHASRVPLDEAPIDTDDPRQGTLFSCGVCDT